MFWPTFNHGIKWAERELLSRGKVVDAGRWQGYVTQGRPDLITTEIINLQLEVPMWRPETQLWPENDLGHYQSEIVPNLPWADDHFAERVSRDPSNPGKQYKNWPWWRGQTDTTQDQGKFSHTYQERFWPKNAGSWEFRDDDGVLRDGLHPMHKGIRYRYGDLDDVIAHLLKNPMSRQATFPIFFPEDTGAVHGGRVPCTLHYSFLLRDDRLHMWYPIRSCDYVRHFRDDLYMAVRLNLWVLNELRFFSATEGDEVSLWENVQPGTLHFTAYSFHIHHGDMRNVQSR